MARRILSFTSSWDPDNPPILDRRRDLFRGLCGCILHLGSLPELANWKTDLRGTCARLRLDGSVRPRHRSRVLHPPRTSAYLRPASKLGGAFFELDPRWHHDRLFRPYRGIYLRFVAAPQSSSRLRAFLPADLRINFSSNSCRLACNGPILELQPRLPK